MTKLPHVIERYWDAVRHRDTSTIESLVDEEFVEDWPQSGERLRGAVTWRRVVEGHPTYPAVSLRRVIGAGDVWVCEADFDYGADSGPWRICSIIETADGRIRRVTQYFGAPFPAADWRKSFVESYDPSSP